MFIGIRDPKQFLVSLLALSLLGACGSALSPSSGTTSTSSKTKALGPSGGVGAIPDEPVDGIDVGDYSISAPIWSDAQLQTKIYDGTGNLDLLTNVGRVFRDLVYNDGSSLQETHCFSNRSFSSGMKDCATASADSGIVATNEALIRGLHFTFVGGSAAKRTKVERASIITAEPALKCYDGLGREVSCGSTSAVNAKLVFINRAVKNFVFSGGKPLACTVTSSLLHWGYIPPVGEEKALTGINLYTNIQKVPSSGPLYGWALPYQVYHVGLETDPTPMEGGKFGIMMTPANEDDGFVNTNVVTTVGTMAPDLIDREFSGGRSNFYVFPPPTNADPNIQGGPMAWTGQELATGSKPNTLPTNWHRHVIVGFCLQFANTAISTDANTIPIKAMDLRFRDARWEDLTGRRGN